MIFNKIIQVAILIGFTQKEGLEIYPYGPSFYISCRRSPLILVLLLSFFCSGIGYAQQIFQDLNITCQGELHDKQCIIHLRAQDNNMDGFYMFITDYKAIKLKGTIDNTGEITLHSKYNPATDLFLLKLSDRNLEGTYQSRQMEEAFPFYAINLRGEYVIASQHKGWFGFRIKLGTEGYELQADTYEKETYPLSIRKRDGRVFLENEKADMPIIVTDSSLILTNRKENNPIFSVVYNCNPEHREVSFLLTDEFLTGESFIEFPEKDDESFARKEKKLQLTDKFSIKVKQISQSSYFLRLWESGFRRKRYKAITNIAEAMSALKGRVKFFTPEEVTEKYMFPDNSVIEISFKDGVIKNLREDDPHEFIAYYPDLQVLVTQAGHSADYSFDLKNSRKEPGNPQYYCVSANEKIRLNAMHPGQDCVEYYFEEWDTLAKEYRIVAEMPYNEAHTCYSSNWVWVDEYTLLFKNFDTYYEMILMKKE